MWNLAKRFVSRCKSDGLLNALRFARTYIDLPNPRHLYVRIYNSALFLDSRIYTSCDIARKLPETTKLPHPVGIVIGEDAEIGEHVLIRQNVTLGERGGDNPCGKPTIHDNVEIHGGAMVLGDVTLHEGCIVGANSVVLNDVGKGKTVVGAPATEIR